MKMGFEEPIMNYEFVTTIATILLVGASIASLTLSAIRSASRTTNERFEKIDARFEKIDERFEKIDERFEKIDARFFEIQKEFTAVHSGIARLEGLIDGIRGALAPRDLSGQDNAA